MFNAKLMLIFMIGYTIIIPFKCALLNEDSNPYLYPCTSDHQCTNKYHECVTNSGPNSAYYFCDCGCGGDSCKRSEDCCTNICNRGECASSGGTQGCPCNGKCGSKIGCAPEYVCYPWGEDTKGVQYGYCDNIAQSSSSVISTSTTIVSTMKGTQSTSMHSTSTQSTPTPSKNTQTKSTLSTSPQSTWTPLGSTLTISTALSSTQSTSVQITSTPSSISQTMSMMHSSLQTSNSSISTQSMSTPSKNAQTTSTLTMSPQSTWTPLGSPSTDSTALSSTQSTSTKSTSVQITSTPSSISQTMSKLHTSILTLNSSMSMQSTSIITAKSASTLSKVTHLTSMLFTSTQQSSRSTVTKPTFIPSTNLSSPTVTTINHFVTSTMQLHTTTENDISRTLDYLANKTVTNSLDVIEILVVLNYTLTVANGSLLAKDLKDVSEILCHCSVVPNLVDRVFYLYMDCYNKVLDQQTVQLQEAQSLYYTSLRYLECVHQMATNMINSSLNYNKENVAMSIIDTNCSSLIDQYNFGLSVVQYSNHTVQIVNDAVLGYVQSMSAVYAFLPYSVLCLNTKLNDVLTRNDFLIYRNQKLFSSISFADSASSNTQNQCHIQQLPQTDNVVSVKVLNTTENYTNLVQPVSYGFRQNKFNESLHAESICAYWRLTWLTNGCKLQKRQKDLYICECSHMTDFSLLVDNSETDPALCDNALSTLGLVLTILSIISLFITIVLKLLGNLSIRSRVRIIERLFRHAKIKSVIGDTFLVTLFFFYILFSILSDGETFALSNHSCAIAGAVLYTMLMVTIFFAGFTGLIFFKVYYIVFNQRHLVFLTSKVFIIPISLGIPAVLSTILWFSIDDFFWRNDRFCWIRPTYISLAVVLPNLVMLLGDIVLSALLIKGFFFTGSRAMQSAKGRRLIIFRKVIILLTVQFIMGLPWIFEYFTLGTPRVIVFNYLFTIANGSQGVWLTVIYLYSFYRSIKSHTRREPNTTETFDNINGRSPNVAVRKDIITRQEINLFSDGQRQLLVSKRRLTGHY